MKEIITKSLLKNIRGIFVWAITLSVLTNFTIFSQQVSSSAIPSNSNPNDVETITVDIQIDMTGMSAPDTLLGSFTASISWDPTVLSYVSNSGILSGFTGAINVNAAGGIINFNGANASGVGSTFNVFQVTFDVIGTGGTSSILDLGYSAMAAAGTFANLLPFLVINDGNVNVTLAAPSSLTGQVFNSPWRVQLSWIDNSDSELGFAISRDDTVSVGFIDIDSVGANVTTYTDFGVDAIFNYVYKVYAYNADTVSEFSNTAGVIVPVELKSFTASLSGNSIAIHWTTTTELNNRGFELERMIDQNWKKIAFIEGHGTTTNESNYNYIDDIEHITVKDNVSYRLKQIDFNGSYKYSDIVEVNVDFTPKEYELYQNYPNPFNPSTIIKYAVPQESKVQLTIYNTIGEVVSVLVNETQNEGFHEVDFNASALSNGIYFYRLVANENILIKKMILLK